MSARRFLAAALAAFILLPASGQAGDLDRLRNAISAGYSGPEPLFVQGALAAPVTRRADQGKTGRTGCATGQPVSGPACATLAFSSAREEVPGPPRPKIYSILRAVPIGTQGRVGLGMDLPRLMSELNVAPANRDQPRFGSNHRR